MAFEVGVTVLAFAVVTGAVHMSFEIINRDMKAAEARDPFRLARWKAGEPLHPDQAP